MTAHAPTRRAQRLQASYLTHELRAPVASIRLSLEILSEQIEGRLEADERRMLAMALKNTASLEGLIDDIMDYSRIRAGKMGLERRPCDARELLSEAADRLQPLAISRGVRLLKEPSGPLPLVSAEGRRLVTVLANLISNALKHTPARGSVTLSAREGTLEHAGTLVFRVKDTGCGIPAGDLERIFGLFEQSGAALRAGEGTGLGLTLARAMVELHGGRIWAESWKGAGATFSFTVPLEGARPYPKPVEYHGLLVGLYRRLNAFLAFFF